MRCLRWTTATRRGLSSLGVLSCCRSSHVLYIEGMRPPAVFFPISPPSQSRAFTLSSIPAVFIPPVVFCGILVTLWAYKCVMMVIFQNKIIYMPSVPPFSRSEKVEDCAVQCRPVVWKEHDLRAADGTALKLLEGSIGQSSASTKRVIVLYLQGNASSLPPRLPYLSAILRSLQTSGGHTPEQTAYTIFALSYRGFWTSRGHATQSGIELDAQAALQWLSDNLLQNEWDTEVRTILWGQSIGAGVATTALATLLAQRHRNANAASSPQHHLPLNIHSLILETPFLSIRSMLVALYPQRFLPYRYLWPFLRSTWDSEAAIKKMTAAAATTTTSSTLAVSKSRSIAENRAQLTLQAPLLKKVLILQAGKDEIVPAEESEVLEQVCRENLQALNVDIKRVIIGGALHTEVMGKPKGREVVVQHLRDAAGDECVQSEPVSKTRR